MCLEGVVIYMSQCQGRPERVLDPIDLELVVLAIGSGCWESNWVLYEHNAHS